MRRGWPGATAPLRQKPVRLERMVHFVPLHVDKVRAEIADMIPQVDVILGNLEDAVPAEEKEAARYGFIDMARAHDYTDTGLWTRINALNSPWALDDICEISAAAGDSSTLSCCPRLRVPGRFIISASRWRSWKSSMACPTRS